MNKLNYDIVTLKPGWSVKDLFTGRTEAANRERILNQLNGQYLNQGWQLSDDIMWGKDSKFAVVKLGRPTQP
jgi:hypothetical protein